MSQEKFHKLVQALMGQGVIDKQRKALLLLSLKRAMISYEQHIGLVKKCDLRPAVLLQAYSFRHNDYQHHGDESQRARYGVYAIYDLHWLAFFGLPDVMQLHCELKDILELLNSYQCSRETGVLRGELAAWIDALSKQGLQMSHTLQDALLQSGNVMKHADCLHQIKHDTPMNQAGDRPWFNRKTWDQIIKVLAGFDAQQCKAMVAGFGPDHYEVISGHIFFRPQEIDRDLLVTTEPWFSWLRWGILARYQFFKRSFERYRVTVYKKRWTLFQEGMKPEQYSSYLACYHDCRFSIQEQRAYCQRKSAWLLPWFHQQSRTFFSEQIDECQQQEAQLKQQLEGGIFAWTKQVMTVPADFFKVDAGYYLNFCQQLKKMNEEGQELQGVQVGSKALLYQWLKLALSNSEKAALHSQSMACLLSFWEQHGQDLIEISGFSDSDWICLEDWVQVLLGVKQETNHHRHHMIAMLKQLDESCAFGSTCNLPLAAMKQRVEAAPLTADSIISHKSVSELQAQLDLVKSSWNWSMCESGSKDWRLCLAWSQGNLVLGFWVFKQLILDLLYFFRLGVKRTDKSIERYLNALCDLFKVLAFYLQYHAQKWLTLLAQNLLEQRYPCPQITQLLAPYITPEHVQALSHLVMPQGGGSGIGSHSLTSISDLCQQVQYDDPKQSDINVDRLLEAMSQINTFASNVPKILSRLNLKFTVQKKWQMLQSSMQQLLDGYQYESASDILQEWVGLASQYDSKISTLRVFAKEIVSMCHKHIQQLFHTVIHEGFFTTWLTRLYQAILLPIKENHFICCSYVFDRLIYLCQKASAIFVTYSQGVRSFCGPNQSLSILQLIFLEQQLYSAQQIPSSALGHGTLSELKVIEARKVIDQGSSASCFYQYLDHDDREGLSSLAEQDPCCRLLNRRRS
jgi:hypothetical protein